MKKTQKLTATPSTLVKDNRMVKKSVLQQCINLTYVSMYLKWQIIATHISTLYSQNAGPVLFSELYPQETLIKDGVFNKKKMIEMKKC